MLTTSNAQGVTTNTYDQAGNRTSTRDPDGRLVTYAYDGGRLVTETWYAAGGSPTDVKTYTYDGDGNRLTASDATGTYTWTYQDDRVVTQTDPNGITLTYGYDADGNVTSICDSQGGVTTMAYNAAGQVTTKTYRDATTQLRVDFRYDEDGNLTAETRYGDVAGTEPAGTTAYTYDGDRLTGITYEDAGGVVLACYGYTYNDAGQLVSKTIDVSTTTYSYDATGQLVQAGGTTYTYDANGNPTGGGDVIGSGNELQSDGTWRYSYDAAGNQVGKVGISNGLTWVYAYNEANRLVSAVETETATGAVVVSATYLYDVLGDLQSETVTTGGVTTVSRFAYAADGSLYADMGSGGVIGTRYVSGVGGADTWLARATAGSGGAWLLSDYQGSVMLVVGLTGGVQDSIVYDGFGNITSETDVASRGELGFQGGRYDAVTGSWMFGVRDFTSSTRMWTTRDPSGLGPDSNPYRFVDNGPTNGIDPSGLQEVGGAEGASGGEGGSETGGGSALQGVKDDLMRAKVDNFYNNFPIWWKEISDSQAKDYADLQEEWRRIFQDKFDRAKNKYTTTKRLITEEKQAKEFQEFNTAGARGDTDYLRYGFYLKHLDDPDYRLVVEKGLGTLVGLTSEARKELEGLNTQIARVNEIVSWGPVEKLAHAFTVLGKRLPGDLWQGAEDFFSPGNLAALGVGTLVGAGLNAVGAGPVVLGIGYAFMGEAVFSIGRQFTDFIYTSLTAHTDEDFARAAEAGGHAITQALTQALAMGIGWGLGKGVKAVRGGFNRGGPVIEEGGKFKFNGKVYDTKAAALEAAKASVAPKQFKVGPHGEMPTPRGGNESHHGVMSRWMEENFGNYNPDKAPAVLMDLESHNATRGVYNTWRAEMRRKMGGIFDWSKVTETDMRALSEKMFNAAEVPAATRAEYYKQFEAYMKTLKPK